MNKNAFLLDVILENDYLKIITDQGNFKRPTSETNNDKLALTALRLVGKRIEIVFRDSGQAFAGEFSDLSGIKQQDVQSALPFSRVFPTQKSQKIFGPRHG